MMTVRSIRLVSATTRAILPFFAMMKITFLPVPFLGRTLLLIVVLTRTIRPTVAAGEEFTLRIYRHQKIALTQKEVDKLLKGASRVIQRKDKPSDTPCDVVLSRCGGIRIYQDEDDGIVDSREKFWQLAPARPSANAQLEDQCSILHVKVVKEIKWCDGTPRFGHIIHGCAGEGNWMVVVAKPFGDIRDAIVVAHEFGHTRGLKHEDPGSLVPADRRLIADSEGWRSAFRTDVDHDSEVMPISIPN